MKRYLVFLTIIFITCLCQAKEWLFFVYMAADNGLYQYALGDINQFEEGIQDNMEIIVFIDHLTGSDKDGAEVLRIVKDSTDVIVSPVVKSYGEVNSGEYQTLNQFMKWGQSKYSGDNEVMVLWSHGTGWFKSANPQIKYVCPDNAYGTAISVAEGDLKKAFAGLKRKHDLLVFDACLMGNLETMTEVKDVADYIIASPNEVPAFGFPWNDILKKWNSYASAEETYKSIPEIYTQSFDYGGSQNPYGSYFYPVALFVAKMNQLGSLLNNIRLFSDTYALSAGNSIFTNARTESFEFNDMLADIEIKEYFSRLKNASNPSDSLYHFSEETLSLIDQMFIKTASLNLSVEGYASIWYPDYDDMFFVLYKDLYHKLDIADYQFPRFLNYSYGTDTRVPDPVVIENQVQNLNSLYLSWGTPIDPCPLKYLIEVYSNNLLLHHEIISQTTYSYTFNHDTVNAFIKITTLDEAGNSSSSVRVDYQKDNHVNFEAYITPNPVISMENAKIRWIQNHPVSRLEFKIYTISGDLIASKTLYHTLSGEHSIDLQQLLKSNKKLSTGLYTLLIKADAVNDIKKFSIIW